MGSLVNSPDECEHRTRPTIVFTQRGGSVMKVTRFAPTTLGFHPSLLLTLIITFSSTSLPFSSSFYFTLSTPALFSPNMALPLGIFKGSTVPNLRQIVSLPNLRKAIGLKNADSFDQTEASGKISISFFHLTSPHSHSNCTSFVTVETLSNHRKVTESVRESTPRHSKLFSVPNLGRRLGSCKLHLMRKDPLS